MNIYELLDELNLNASIDPERKLFTEEKKNCLDTDEEKELFELLKNLSSLPLKKTDHGYVFCPYLHLNKVKIFAVEDLTEDDYERLKAQNLPEIPAALRARICHLLWAQKKDHKAARTAARSYLFLFKIWIARDPIKETVNVLEASNRAVSIAKQLRDSDLLDDIHKSVYDAVQQTKGHNEGVLRLRLLEILVDDKYGDQEELLSVADDLITNDPANMLREEQVYDVKKNCLRNMNDQKGVNNCDVQLADFYVECADKMVDQQIQGALRADIFYNKAIQSYRENKEKSKAEKTLKRLYEVREIIPKEMHTFAEEFDVKDAYKCVDENFEGLAFEESIIRLTQLITFYKKDDVKKDLLDELKETPLLGQITKKKFDTLGRNVLILEPLNLQNPEENTKLLDKYINQKLQRKCKFAGDITVRRSLDNIRGYYDLQKVNLEFLVKDNAIIPEGREGIFAAALMMFLTGQYYECVHILAPQTENLFRNIVKECGDETSTLENDGTTKERTLGPVFDLPKLWDCYDNDILFLFKALLNESSGSNIRNEVAHGITDARRANSGDYLFFAAAVMKLLTKTSLNCMKIYKESEKLRNIIKPERGNHG